jgi:hypothetical protein
VAYWGLPSDRLEPPEGLRLVSRRPVWPSLMQQGFSIPSAVPPQLKARPVSPPERLIWALQELWFFRRGQRRLPLLQAYPNPSPCLEARPVLPPERLIWALQEVGF